MHSNSTGIFYYKTDIHYYCTDIHCTSSGLSVSHPQ